MSDKSYQRLLLRRFEARVELNSLLDADRSRAVLAVHEAEHRIKLLGLEAERCRQCLHDLRRRPIVAALDLAQVRVGDARHAREIALRNLCQPPLRSHELAESLKLFVAVGHSEPSWRSGVLIRLWARRPKRQARNFALSQMAGRSGFGQDFVIARRGHSLVATRSATTSPVGRVPNNDAARVRGRTDSALRVATHCSSVEHSRRDRSRKR